MTHPPEEPAGVLARLAQAGVQLDWLNDDQRQVLLDLSSDELALLLSIKARLDEVSPDVQAHSEIAGGALF
ncbi:aroma-sacti cluster domain-containing protein [Streptomyces sp.]|uniref:aroma-sacti cluster domain-containing protein n=1 Tax=Streptomyces sp. TaxID=1931 RepID=UPI002F404DFE